MDYNLFFGIHINPTTLGGQCNALLLAAFLGGLIGLEREWHGHPAGMRTHILVCVGCTLITLTSVMFASGFPPAQSDPARLAAQIVSGIGFLGAGAIIREGGSIHGLTTAASIWTTAAIGIAVGTHPRLGELAVMATLIVLITLVFLNKLEDRLGLKQRLRCLTIEIAESSESLTHLFSTLAENNIQLQSLTPGSRNGITAETPHKDTQRFSLLVRLPGGFNRTKFFNALAKIHGLVSFTLE